MPTVLLVFEFLGTTELMVIALVALIIFGPRKLPEIGRTLGRSLAEFKRASDDFKRTWEYEVELEQRKPAPVGARESDNAGEVSNQVLAASANEMTTSGGAEVSMSSADTHETQTIARNSFAAESGQESNEASNVAAANVGATFDEGDGGEDELNAS
jgi:TatA/E family protein of Tat protein translocase